MLQRLPAEKLKLVAVFVIVVFPIAAAAARFDVWHFRNSFLLFAIATLVAFIVLVLSVLKLSRAVENESKSLIAAIVLSALPLGYMGLNIVKANQYPFIHDITTDFENPPQFIAAATLRGEGDHSIEYAGGEVAAMQKAGYTDLAPLLLNRDAKSVYSMAKAAMIEKGWKVTTDQAQTEPYILEAVDTTLIMGFKDDIVIRIQSTGDNQTRVDARSKSRVGKSDLGKNAQRIQDLFMQLSR